jgi:hypothetical protein
MSGSWSALRNMSMTRAASRAGCSTDSRSGSRSGCSCAGRRGAGGRGVVCAVCGVAGGCVVMRAAVPGPAGQEGCTRQRPAHPAAAAPQQRPYQPPPPATSPHSSPPGAPRHPPGAPQPPPRHPQPPPRHPQPRAHLQVEDDAAVVHLARRHLGQHLLELGVLPGGGAVRHHGGGRVVVLVVCDVQGGELAPVLLLVAGADEARDVDALGEELQVLHQLVWPGGRVGCVWWCEGVCGVVCG